MIRLLEQQVRQGEELRQQMQQAKEEHMHRHRHRQ